MSMFRRLFTSNKRTSGTADATIASLRTQLNDIDKLLGTEDHVARLQAIRQLQGTGLNQSAVDAIARKYRHASGSLLGFVIE